MSFASPLLSWTLLLLGYWNIVVAVILVFGGNNNEILVAVTKNETNTAGIRAATIITITRICCVFITRIMLLVCASGAYFLTACDSLTHSHIFWIKFDSILRPIA